MIVDVPLEFMINVEKDLFEHLEENKLINKFDALRMQIEDRHKELSNSFYRIVDSTLGHGQERTPMTVKTTPTTKTY